MNERRKLLLALAGVLLVAIPILTNGDDRPLDVSGLVKNPSTRVLMVGNSYTFYNDMPSMLSKLLKERLGQPVRVEAAVVGGFRFDQHLASKHSDLIAAGKRGGWTHVVFQEQSQIPGFHPQHPEFVSSQQAFKDLAKLARESGAKVALFLTWGHQLGDVHNPRLFPDYSTMQAKLVEGYTRYQRLEPDSEIAPVGLAFQAIHDERPDVFRMLYSPDHSHPSMAGSYLAACVLAHSVAHQGGGKMTYVPTELDTEVAAYLRAKAKEAGNLSAD